MGLKRRRQSKKRRFSKRFGKYGLKIHPGQDMDEYTERNRILEELGFRDYKAYLRSKLWKGIREKKLEKNSNCYGCNRDSGRATMQVHHSKYTRENLTGENLEHLFSICSRCHHWIEVTKSGYKRTPSTATRELLRVRKIMIARMHKI